MRLLSSLVLVVGLVTVGPAAVAAPDEPSAPYPVRVFTPTADDAPELVEAWETWTARALLDYETNVMRSCFCLPQKAVVTTVSSGTVTSVTRADRPGRELKRRGYPVDRLFFLLRDAYADADGLDVVYGAGGVPKKINIDWDEQLADEELYFTVHLTRG